MSRRRTILSVLLFVGISGGGMLLSSFLRPHATAYEGHCVQRTGPDLANSCDFDIIMSFCQQLSERGSNDDPCTQQTLRPGEPFTNYPDGAMQGKTYTMACKAPYPPAWQRSQTNSAHWIKRCRKAPQT